ncbi:MAG TPA: AarF/ABC1/UbiB kinase family protein [Rhizobiales bacterium]|nr:AarF/ABC1/UbiB kinase family protein [Hyphomicrobiales bacterium]
MKETRMNEHNRLTGRLRRYAKVGVNVGGTAARAAGARIAGSGSDRENEARLLKDMLGNLKGPLMKVAQMLATIPEAVPAEYAEELAKLQSHAPAMGWPFVKRRMAGELGRNWQNKFAGFDHEASAAASLGQVHKAQSLDGRPLACKLQYPDMDSAVEADLKQLSVVFALHRRMGAVIDTSEMSKEIAERLREELDYAREARHMALYQNLLRGQPEIRVPGVCSSLSTRRLLTMDWLQGRSLLDFKRHSLDERNLLARLMFNAWWRPFCAYGIIHGDPHLGNYSAYVDGKNSPLGLNLLDYGCIRIFPPRFVAGVVELYQGLRGNDRDRIVAAYESWGFEKLDNELIDILNIWARFIYGPLMDDRVRTVADGVSAAQYGRKQAFAVHKALKQKGPLKIPREFVFMDRAAIGLGGVFLHLGAELNFYELFNSAIDEFSLKEVEKRQKEQLKSAGLV